MSELPRSVREALARQTAADEHPSADLLNGFMEHALAADEHARVTTHLSVCADCREIIFLAGATVEEEQQVALAAAQSVPRVAAANLAEVRPALTIPERPRVAWLSWKWLVPAVAALAIVTTVVVHHINRPLIQNSQTVAMNSPSSLLIAPEQSNTQSATVAGNDKASSAVSTPVDEKKSKAAEEAQLKEIEKRERLLQQQIAGSLKVDRNAEMASSQIAQSVPPNAIGGAAAGRPAADAASSSKSMAKVAAPPNPQAAKRAETNTVEVSNAAAAATPQATAKVELPALSNLLHNKPNGGNDITYINQTEPKAAASMWRITDDGHLQRATASGTWTPVLIDQTVFFHTVAIVGGDVWAGGNGGALFHSSDNGEHWTRVALAAGGQAAHGAVRLIRFTTSTVGTVTTDSGETWSTSDGGKIWSRK